MKIKTWLNAIKITGLLYSLNSILLTFELINYD